MGVLDTRVEKGMTNKISPQKYVGRSDGNQDRSGVTQGGEEGGGGGIFRTKDGNVVRSEPVLFNSGRDACHMIDGSKRRGRQQEEGWKKKGGVHGSRKWASSSELPDDCREERGLKRRGESGISRFSGVRRVGGRLGRLGEIFSSAFFMRWDEDWAGLGWAEELTGDVLTRRRREGRDGGPRLVVSLVGICRRGSGPVSRGPPDDSEVGRPRAEG